MFISSHFLRPIRLYKHSLSPFPTAASASYRSRNLSYRSSLRPSFLNNLRATPTRTGSQQSSAQVHSEQQRRMTTVNKTEEEWRAVLSPEQVSSISYFSFPQNSCKRLHCYCFLYLSSGSYARKAPNARAQVNTTSSTKTEPTAVRAAELLCIRVRPSSMYASV
jgi:hypothetical protein